MTQYCKFKKQTITSITMGSNATHVQQLNDSASHSILLIIDIIYNNNIIIIEMFLMQVLNHTNFTES